MPGIELAPPARDTTSASNTGDIACRWRGFDSQPGQEFLGVSEVFFLIFFMTLFKFVEFFHVFLPFF